MEDLFDTAPRTFEEFHRHRASVARAALDIDPGAYLIGEAYRFVRIGMNATPGQKYAVLAFLEALRAAMESAYVEEVLSPRAIDERVTLARLIDGEHAHIASQPECGAPISTISQM